MNERLSRQRHMGVSPKQEKGLQEKVLFPTGFDDK